MNKQSLKYILSIYILCFPLLINTVVFGQERINSVNDTISLQEVIVSQDKKPMVTGALSGKIVLNAEGIKDLPSIMGNTNILKMLELTPGVQTSGDANSNLYVRGGDPGQNLLLYNGNTIYTPGHILSFFPLFNIDHLSSLELMKSGVSAQYGGFSSSVISVSSKDEIPNKISFKGNVGLLSSQSTIDVPIAENWGAYVSGRITYLDLLLKPLLKATINDDAEQSINDMGSDFYDVNTTLIGKLSETNKLTVDLFYSKDKLQLKDEEIAIDGKMNWENMVLSARLNTILKQSMSLEQSVKYSKFKNRLQTFQSEMILSIFSSIEDIGYSNKLNYYISDIPFYSGLQYTYHNILPQETSIKNVGFDYQSENLGRNTAHDISVYTSAQLRLTPQFYIEPGLRYTLYYSKVNKIGESKTFHSIDYRLSSRYQLDETRFIRASFSHNSQYINKLTPSSLGLPTDFWITSSAIILPQKGDEVSLGFYKSINDGLFEVSSDIYFRRVKNATEFNQNFIENDNVIFTDKVFYGRAKAYGLELMLKKNTGKFTGWLSYTIGRSTRQFDDIDDGRSYPAKYDRTHDFSLLGAYAFNKKWTTSMTFIYATGNTYTQPSSWYFMNGVPVKEYGKYNGARMPDYSRADVSVNYWFKKDNGLNFSIYNMFMVNNPIYVFLLVGNDKNDETLRVRIKQKKLFTIIPSISWKYKF